MVYKITDLWINNKKTYEKLLTCFRNKIIMIHINLKTI